MSIRRGLRVGFTGAGGTGKTTSALFIANEFGIPVSKSASRIIYEAKEISEEDVRTTYSNEQKWELQKEILNIKIENDRGYTYVADRTVLDHYAYGLSYCSGFLNNDQFTWFDEIIHNLMLSTYSHIFYFPWGFWTPDKSDGIRQDRMSWQSQIDAIIVGYLHRWGIPAIIVPQMEGIEGRNEFIKKTILGENK